MHVVVRALQGTAPLVARLKELVGDAVTVANDDAELAAAIPTAGLLLITDNLYSAEVARMLREHAVALKWIQLLSAGYDAVARHGVPQGVTVTNAGDAYAPSVATHAVSLLLAVQRQFPAFLANQKRQIWDRSFAPRCMIPFDSRIAVIGFGHIGSEIGRLLRGFGARITAVTRQARPHQDADEVAPIGELQAILPRADAIVIALAASPEVRHLIGAKAFGVMKSNAVLVNIARGYVVDCVALAAALKNGTIAGAGLDVTEPEPLPEGHPLWDAPNLIIAPHMAGASGLVTARRVAKVAGDNVARWLAGEPLAHLISL
jgi:phosphoglycerate dehydrogenase-like enzyme